MAPFVKSRIKKNMNHIRCIFLSLLMVTLLTGCEPVTTSSTAPSVEKKTRLVEVGSMKALGEYYDSIGYNFSTNPDILGDIPRLRFTHVPKNWEEERSIPLKKSVFFRTMAAMALEVNEAILQQRTKLLNLEIDGMTADELAWLDFMMKRYKISRNGAPYSKEQIEELHLRVDIIPLSLTIVQSAIESAWGSSRFAQEGNALFGQWTTSNSGIKAERSEARLAKFSSPRESVAAYCLNLNTHPSYSIFRVARAEMRRRGRYLKGAELAMHLEKYSEKGVAYTTLVKNMIHRHDLEITDRAKLADGQEIVVKPLDRPI